ncbi:MAG TPA: ABC transporter permease, partial [Piscirickettsiaceae bacterium]|nr:ABC transporter permease [Piscirickettsiaceae bacterium]
MSLVVLWTDALVWLLVVMLTLWSRVALRDRLVRERWQQVFASGMATASA